MTQPAVYIPGRRPDQSGPLGRYLPPIPEGVAAQWLRSHLPPGAWVVEPFGSGPRTAMEAAAAGYRVLAAANNPVSRFLFEYYAKPLGAEELRSTLADLAASPKADERLEPHLRRLYMTHCTGCGASVEAQAFVWERGASAPSAKIYQCPNCKDSGERPATAQDAEHARRSSGGPLHRARALERVARLADPDRGFVEEALAMYLPRAVYALFTLVNKLDSTPASQRRALEALLLYAFDTGSVMWAYPPNRARPKQLGAPPRFLERNIWLALEEAVTAWPAALGEVDGRAIPVQAALVSWPELPPPEGGVCLYEGRLRDLAAGVHAAGGQPPELAAGITARETAFEAGGLPFRIDASLTVLPRPNQAFWTLSALWSGWLWGAEAGAGIKSVLRRRRYDWDWHSEALHANLSHLGRLLSPGTPLLGLMGEAEPGFLSAALSAADRAGFRLDGVALRSDEAQAQIAWRRAQAEPDGAPEPAVPDESLTDCVRRAAVSYLMERGEPCGYLELHAAVLSALAQDSRLALETTAGSDHSLERINTALSMTLETQSVFARYGGSSRSLEVGRWWLSAAALKTFSISTNKDRNILPGPSLPLADRVEMAVVRYLLAQTGATGAALDAALCAEFPGLLTPDRKLVQVCIDSYGEPVGTEGGRLRAEDAPQARRADLEKMKSLLEAVGTRLGFDVQTGNSAERPTVRWLEAGGGYIFHIIASAVLGGLPPGGADSVLRPVVVLPGGRAGLVQYKMERDPRIQKAIADGLRLLKYRHVRRLAEDPRLTRHNLEAQMDLDPLDNRDAQMSLL